VTVMFAGDLFHRDYMRDVAHLRISLNLQQHNFTAPIHPHELANQPALRCVSVLVFVRVFVCACVCVSVCVSVCL